MKQILLIGGIVFVGAAGWQLGDKLSPDAITLVLGVLFGCMAGIPAMLIVSAYERSRYRGPAPIEPWPSAYKPPAQLPEPTQWRVAEKRQRIDATVTARRIEAKR